MSTATETPEAAADTPTTIPPESGFNSMADQMARWSDDWHKENDISDEPGSKKLDASPAEHTAPGAKAEPKGKEAPAAPAAAPDKKDAPAKDTPKDAPKEEPIPESIKSPKAQEDWKKLKTDRDGFKGRAEKAESELAKLNEQLKTRTNGSAPPEEIKKLTEERDALRTKLETVDLANSERFTTYFKNEIGKQVAVARNAAGDHADGIAKLLEQPRSESRNTKLREALEQLDPIDADVVRQSLANIERLRVEREQALADGAANYQKLKETERQEQAKALEANKQRIEAMADDCIAKARELEAFKTIEGDDAHNEAVKTREGFIRGFLRGELPENVVAWTPVLAGEALYLRERVIPQLKEENEKLKAQVASYVSASPRAGGGDHREGEAAPQGFKQIFMQNNPRP